MKPISEFDSKSVRIVFTDIDGTLTDRGRLPDVSYKALWALHDAGFHVIPVTGRPAGWCELIARLWPVHGVVGENGAFYFRLEGGRMRRRFARAKSERRGDKARLKQIAGECLKEVPGCAIASDQFSRLFDLAIDFSEDVEPLPEKQIDKIASIFAKHGAHAKISNIHVNGWFGDYDKLTACIVYLRKEFGILDEAEMKRICTFVGDSPNDEPMFGFFPLACAVANIKAYAAKLNHLPAFVASLDEGEGFAEIADALRNRIGGS